MTRRVVEKLCTEKVCVDFLAPRCCCSSRAVPLVGESSDSLNAKVSEGFIMDRVPGPHPRIRLALPSSRVDLASKQSEIRRCRINVKSMSSRCEIDP